MQLFVTGIPAYTKSRELCDLAIQAGSYWFIKPKEGRVYNCEILKISDPQAETISYYGLVSVKDEPLGRRIINRLNGAIFRQSQIKVREYAHRVPGDRRFKDEAFGLYRPYERRRKNLSIERLTLNPATY